MDRVRFTVKQARMYRDLTQQEIADLLGIHRDTYKKYEENPEQMPMNMGKRIAEITTVPFDDILFESNSTTG